MRNKKLITVFIVSILSILLISLYFVYLDYLDKAPKPKEILDEGVLLIYPRFTEIAYAKDSFYAYYNEMCDQSCLTQPLDREKGNRYVLGLNGFDYLNHNYISASDLFLNSDSVVNDIELSNFHTVILFHNEYVTKKLFDQITSHPNVVYLYPNSLYAEVSVNYDDNTMTLVRGHGYPSSEIANGFDWKHENTEQEDDCKEGQWNFYKVSNGIMLDCYPENIIKKDKQLQKYIHNYIRESDESQ